MKIGIIGAGGIAQIYGRLWREAGHEIMISSRHPGDLHEVASSIGAATRSGTIFEAAEYGEVILLAVNFASIEPALQQIETLINGKVVIDATNPLVAREDGPPRRVIGDDEIAGILMQKRLPGAIIVKSFTTMWTEYVKKQANRNAPVTAMPFSTDSADARVTISTLIEDAGLVPVDLGSLVQSRPIDPPSPIWNEVLTPKELTARIATFRADGQAS
ncbi:NAD(P)-binding domain-containing protein [uncultured Roseobacter sp.]|uniref:NADPH-dependent F420 reductase n=1 Tax=uncultured Roseobacter sp. TaxID=114847 RepID=UPI00260C08C2|nr:NAD(P)-binding domain-containing protein [uncultured Roseobacter sp.]